MVLEALIVVLALVLASMGWHAIELKLSGDVKPHDVFPHFW
jgi:purine-cytosine permease-like protein